jgi:DDE superfamily endonuclease
MAQLYTSEQLIFIDESSKDERTQVRRFGWAPYNKRAKRTAAYIRGKRYTILPALSINGIFAVDIMEGSCTSKLFYDFIVEKVVSTLQLELAILAKSVDTLQAPHMSPYPGPRSVIVMDNARIHHNQQLIDLIEGFGGRVEFLPPYSPDFNPIEEAFSCVKAWLRRNEDYVDSCWDVPELPLLEACMEIDAYKARAYFEDIIYIL